MFRPDRAHRGGARRLRPEGDRLRTHPAAVLGEPRPHPGHAAGNDHGTQYRSAIYTHDETQIEVAEATAEAFGKRLADAGYGQITTEIAPLTQFYYAEDYHQQYLAKNPNGYCPVHATGVSCPVGLGA